MLLLLTCCYLHGIDPPIPPEAGLSGLAVIMRVVDVLDFSQATSCGAVKLESTLFIVTMQQLRVP